MIVRRVVQYLGFTGAASLCVFLSTSFVVEAAPKTQTPTTTKATSPTLAGNRSIFLNGIDVSSARNQDLRNVHIRISDNGDIFITAPQYQVNEEETFTPLSTYIPGAHPPVHTPPMDMADVVKSDSESAQHPDSNDKNTTKPADAKSDVPEKPASAPPK